MHSYNGALNSEVLINKHLLVAAGTQTAAGVDLRDYIGEVKVILTWSGAAADGANSMQASILDSADNTTFAANTHATFAAVTASSGQVSVGLDTRKFNRYIQGKLLTSSTTATFTTSMVLVGAKQVE